MARYVFVTNLLGLDGTPESGGLIDSFVRGTSTRTPIYAAASGSTTLANPAVGDALGQVTGYLDDSVQYSLRAKSANSATTFWEADVVSGIVSLTYINPEYSESPIIHVSWLGALGAPLGSRWSEHFGNALPQFYLDDYYETTWQAALNAANDAAEAVGGGIIYAHGREEYAFTGYPDPLSAGVYVFGIPNYTRFKMPTTGGTLIRWTGATVGSAKTLSGNISVGDETIGVTSGSDIAAGDLLQLIKVDGSLSIAHPSQLFRVEAKPSANSITVANRARFATATSDTYTLQKITPIVGGGLYGVIFDGSACTTDLQCIGVFPRYMSGALIDYIGGEYMSGSDPDRDNSDGSVIQASDCWDMRGLNDLWAYKSGSVGACDIQFFRMGPTQYGSLHSEQSTGFGPGIYDSADQQDIASIYSLQAQQRAAKIQCSNAVVGRICVDKPALTGAAFGQGAIVDIANVEYTNTDAPTTVSVTSLVRASNVVTMTLAANPHWANGRTIVIAGAVSADDMNGTVTATRVNATTYTYPDTGANETATGTITATPQVTPSLWLDGEGSNKVTIQTARFWGATNSGGDMHAGSTDSLHVDKVYTQWGTAPTYGGTATYGTQIINREVNGVTQEIGFATSTYFTVRDFAATSGATGYKVIVKDAGGVSRNGFLYLNSAGNMLVQAPSGLGLYLYGAAAYVQNSLLAETDAASDIGATAANRFRDLHVSRGIRASGRDVIDAQGYDVFKTAAATAIADVTNAINTTGKAQGRAVLDTTNNRLMIASGSTAAAAWYYADGSASVTPA